MKIMPLATAALVAIAGLSATAADAQTRTVVTTHREVHTTRTGPGFDRHRTRRVCRTDVRHGHRVRTCRTVRY